MIYIVYKKMYDWKKNLFEKFDIYIVNCVLCKVMEKGFMWFYVRFCVKFIWN